MTESHYFSLAAAKRVTRVFNYVCFRRRYSQGMRTTLIKLKALFGSATITRGHLWHHDFGHEGAQHIPQVAVNTFAVFFAVFSPFKYRANDFFNTSNR